MSDKNLARRTRVEISFEGVDITSSMLPYFLSLTYTDNQEDETDDLQISLQDTSGIWETEWLNQIVDAAVAGASDQQLAISAVIVRQNWNGDGTDEILETGTFMLDKVDCSGPPATVKISASSLPYSSQIRQTTQTKAWEAYTLKGIADEMSTTNGMVCMYLSEKDPYYDRVEQYQVSDIEFLQKLCHDAGCSLKVTNKTIVIFDQADYESKDAIRTIKKGDGSYNKYKLMVSTNDVQYAKCRVWYNDPATGACIEGFAEAENEKKKDDEAQLLEIYARVGSIGEAQTLAAKCLRLYNKYARTVQFSFPFDPELLAGLNIQLEDWGGWNGKYIITQAKHVAGSSGSTTTINARKVIEELPPVEETPVEKKEYNVGDVVDFFGGPHYISSVASSSAGTATAGKAKIAYKNPGSAHPYSLIGGMWNELEGDSSVYGWVDEGTFA